MKKFGLFSKILVLAGAVSSLSGCIFTQAKIEKQLNVVDSKALKYKVGDVFNSYIDNGGLSVKVLMSDNSETSLAKGSYSLTISSKEDPDYYVNPDREFKNAGDYVVSVTRGKLDPAKYDIKVSETEKQLVDISISDQKTSFVKDDTFTFGGKVMANYSDGTSEDVTSQATFSGYNLSNAGNQTVTVSFGGKSKTYSITVTESKILVTSVALDVKSKSLYVDDTFTVNATVLPSDATNKTLTWTSSNSIVATVSNGFITAKSAGSATITAKATDGSAKKATLTLIVSNKPVDVTGISLNKTTLSLKAGETAQLTATISPSNATDKAVNWSGSANGITVNSSGLVSVSSTATVGKTATIVATAHGNTAKTASCVVTIAETPVGERDAWTLLIYMCGADLESDRSQGGAATEDLSEIYSIRSSLPNDVNVVIQAGGASSWKSTYSSVINKDKCNRFHLTKTGYVKDSQTTKVNMGLESSLESFVEWGLTTYPADKVGLVFWNHGGAMDGCCFDEQSSNDGLTPAEVASAIPTAISRSNYNQKLEFIGYDCCLMSIQDIAGLNSEYAKYMIASEEAEWGYGWTYNEWVDDLFAKNPTETILKACVDSFYSETEETYDYWGEDNDQTLAYYNLQNWDAYETAWEDFSQYLSSSVIKSSSNWTTFKNVVNSAKKYGRYTETQVQSYNNGYICDIFDVKDFLNKFKASSSYKSNTTLMNKVSSILTAFSGLSVYSRCGSAAGNSYGLCMFCPISGYNEKDVQYDENNTCFTYWRSLCRTYGNWYY